MKIRKTLTDESPIEVINAFRSLFIYNKDTGLISNKVTSKIYEGIHTTGYRNQISFQKDKIEYRITYHRLCWFLYYGILLKEETQLDHKDNIRTNNRIDNLRETTNNLNIKKKLNYKNSTSIYKGVSKVNDKNKYGSEYIYFSSTITVDKKTHKIGRFKNEKLAAIIYDSANRYYFKDYSLCNFDKEYIEPMTIENLRLLKTNKLKIKEIENEIFKDSK